MLEQQSWVGLALLSLPHASTPSRYIHRLGVTYFVPGKGAVNKPNRPLAISKLQQGVITKALAKYVRITINDGQDMDCAG